MQQPGTGLEARARVRSRQRRLLGPLVIAAIGLLGAAACIGFGMTGPYRTLRGLQSAIAFNDTAALEQYVDFPTLRANLKQQLDARARTQVNAALPGGILSQIASGIADSVTGAAVDTLVTPVGFNKLVLGASLVAGELKGETSGTLTQRFESGEGSFDGLDRFTYTIRPNPTHRLTLILTRGFLAWRLTNILLPQTP